MADELTCNGLPVLRTALTMPPQGTWSASVEVSTDTPPSGPQQLELLGVTYQGSVWVDPDSTRRASGVYAGVASFRIVGGAGGLGRPMTAIGYDNGATVQQALADLLGAADERVSSTIIPALLAQQLPQWAWTASPVDAQLGALATYLGVLWRVLPDGTVWLGVDSPSPPPVELTEYVVVDVKPSEGTVEVTAEVCRWQPGQALDGLPIKQVQHIVSGEGARTLVTYKPGPAAGLLSLFWRWLTRAGWDFARPQPGVVAAQNPDGTLQVQIDGGHYAPLRSVGIDTGLPDTTVQVAPGARVLVEWRTGRPTQPVVTAWGKSTALKINLAASAGSDSMMKGTTYRTAQAQLNADLYTNFVIAGVALAAAGADVSFATAFPTAAAGLTTAGQALGAAAGVAKNLADFEAQAATFLSQIAKVG